VELAALAIAADLDNDPLATLAKLVQEKKKQLPSETTRNHPTVEAGGDKPKINEASKYQEHRKQSRKTDEVLNYQRTEQLHQKNSGRKAETKSAESQDKGRKTDVLERHQQGGQFIKAEKSRAKTEADQLIRTGSSSQSRKEDQLARNQEDRNINVYETNKQAERQTNKQTEVVQKNNILNMSTRDRRRGMTASTDMISSFGTTEYKMTEATRFKLDNMDSRDMWLDNKQDDSFRYNRDNFPGSSKLNLNNNGLSRLTVDSTDSSRLSFNNIVPKRSTLDIIKSPIPIHRLERTVHQLKMTTNSEILDFQVAASPENLNNRQNSEKVQSQSEAPSAVLKVSEWPIADTKDAVEENSKQRQGRLQENVDLLSANRNQVISRGGRKSTRTLAKNRGNFSELRYIYFYTYI
jgi:hypothetical protein